MRSGYLLAALSLAVSVATTALAQSDSSSSVVLVGRVTDFRTGDGIEEITVEADDEQHHAHRTLTLKDGSYRLEKLPKAARLRVRCESSIFGRKPEEDDVLLKGSTTSHDIELFPIAFTDADLQLGAQRLFQVPNVDATQEARRVIANLPLEQIKKLSVDYAALSLNSGDFSKRNSQIMAIFNAHNGMKPRIAVFPFDDRTNANPDMKIGTKVADLLISELTESGAFTVLDRQYVDNILKESNRKYDPNYDSVSAAKAALLGTVDLVVAGQINAYNATTKVNDAQPVSATLHEVDGVVSLKANARLISVEKASITGAPSASSDQRTVMCKTNTVKGAPLELCAQNVDRELGRYVDLAAEEIAKQLSVQIINPVAASGQSSAGVDTSSQAGTPGVVLGLTEGLAYIDKGSEAGVKVGDRFTIRRSIPTAVTDSNVNQIVRHKAICTLIVENVEDSSAAGKCIPKSPLARGSDAIPRKGDEVIPNIPN